MDPAPAASRRSGFRVAAGVVAAGLLLPPAASPAVAWSLPATPKVAGAVVIFTDGSRVTRFSVQGDIERLCWERKGRPTVTEIYRRGILVSRTVGGVTTRFVQEVYPDYRAVEPGHWSYSGRALVKGKTAYRFKATHDIAEEIEVVDVAGRKIRAYKITAAGRFIRSKGVRETWRHVVRVGLASRLPLTYSLDSVIASSQRHTVTIRAKSVYLPGTTRAPPERPHACTDKQS